MVGIVFPPLPSRFEVVRAGPAGVLVVEGVVDHPAGYHLPDKARSRSPSGLIAEYCVEQVTFGMLPAFDAASAARSFALARKHALDCHPAVLYRLRVEGRRFGPREAAAAQVALQALQRTTLEPVEVVAFVAQRTPAAWARFLRDLNRAS